MSGYRKVKGKQVEKEYHAQTTGYMQASHTVRLKTKHTMKLNTDCFD